VGAAFGRDWKNFFDFNDLNGFNGFSDLPFTVYPLPNWK
jgi:hypothetical protein